MREPCEGEPIAIFGPNGSGKTALLRQLASRRALLVPENPDDFFVRFTVADEVAYMLEEEGVAPQEIRDRVFDALRTVGLSDRAWDPVHSLSGGQKRRLALAVALAAGTPRVLLDMPYMDLDPEIRGQLRTILSAMIESCRTVVYTTPKRRYAANNAVTLGSPQDHVELPEPRTVEGEVRARGLALAYGDRNVLSGVDLEVGSGEVVCVVGPNGSGKTTLGKALAGLVKPRRGTVVSRGPRAYVPQTPDLAFIGTTIREEAKALGVPRLAQAFEKHADTPIYALNRGLRRLAAVTAIMASGLGVVVLDEPTNDLDDRYTSLMASLIREAAGRGTAIVVVTHDPDLAAEACSRFTRVDGGALAEVNAGDAMRYLSQ